MTRTLRPRTSRVSYTSLTGGVSDDEQGEPSRRSLAVALDGDSGSDFAPEPGNTNRAEKARETTDDNPVSGEDSVKEDDTMEDVLPVKKPVPSRRKSEVGSDSVKTLPASAPGLARPSTRQMYTLPAPSVHHRHRAVPLYKRATLVERLLDPPKLFTAETTTATNDFTHSATVTDRVNKAWGHNVGCGPLWELVEDRAWFKEAAQNSVAKEEHSRPIVYASLKVLPGWKILPFGDAIPYLPSDETTTEDGQLIPPPTVACSFGPFENQTRVELNMFDTQRISEFIPESKSHVFSAGAPVWGLDWCPLHPTARKTHNYTKYIAIAPLPSRAHSPQIGKRITRPSFGCIQIWSLSASANANVSDDTGEMKCEMVVCIDSGPALELKWCPLPSHDFTEEPRGESIHPRKLGLLGGIFEDGSMSIFVIPNPADMTPVDHDESSPVYVHLPEPILRIELGDANCCTLDWANSELIAIGTTHGTIAVFNIGNALRERMANSSIPPSPLLPTHYIPIHQSAVRALAWIRAPPTTSSGAPRVDGDPTVIATGGYDGIACMTDIREGHGSIMNRTRDVINTMSFSPFAGGPITIDHENIIKAFSASPSMLGRGHTLLEPGGPAWSLHSSDFHPQLAVASADGAVCTTNTLRSTRRGGSVPFFVHKIYQLDYSRNSGEYRMLERFLPQETQDKTAISGKNKAKVKDPLKVTPPGTSAWPSEVGAQRVVWNNGNGLSCAGLLASTTAAGLCRIDWLQGRWLRDKVPYHGITQIRQENVDDIDENFEVDGDSDTD